MKNHGAHMVHNILTHRGRYENAVVCAAGHCGHHFIVNSISLVNIEKCQNSWNSGGGD